VSFVAIAAPPGNGGYWLLNNTGEVYAHGSAGYDGGASTQNYHGLFVSIAATPTGKGYWLLDSAGEIFSLGDAAYHGGASTKTHTGSFVAMAATPTGNGYWLLDRAGEIFSFGDAIYYGGASTKSHVGSFIALAATSTGKGYWLLDSAGEVYSFGDAQYHGNGSTSATGSFVGIARTPDNGGYWLLTSAGQIYSRANAIYHQGGSGSFSGRYVGLAATSTGGGYWLLDSGGQVYARGDAPYNGNSTPPDGCSNGVDKDIDVSSYAACFAQLGYKFVGRYLGGINYISTRLSTNEAQAITSAGLFLACFYVGSNALPGNGGTQSFAQGQVDAQDAFNLAQAVGQPPNSAIYLDLEANQMGTTYIAYAQGWTQQLATLGYQPGIYSSPSQLDVLRGQPWAGLTVLYWNAQETRTTPLFPAPCPSSAPNATYAQAWQYLDTSGYQLPCTPPIIVDIDSVQNTLGLWRAA